MIEDQAPVILDQLEVNPHRNILWLPNLVRRTPDQNVMLGSFQANKVNMPRNTLRPPNMVRTISDQSGFHCWGQRSLRDQPGSILRVLITPRGIFRAIISSFLRLAPCCISLWRRLWKKHLKLQNSYLLNFVVMLWLPLRSLDLGLDFGGLTSFMSAQPPLFPQLKAYSR